VKRFEKVKGVKNTHTTNQRHSEWLMASRGQSPHNEKEHGYT